MARLEDKLDEVATRTVNCPNPECGAIMSCEEQGGSYGIPRTVVFKCSQCGTERTFRVNPYSGEIEYEDRGYYRYHDGAEPADPAATDYGLPRKDAYGSDDSSGSSAGAYSTERKYIGSGYFRKWGQSRRGPASIFSFLLISILFLILVFVGFFVGLIVLSQGSAVAPFIYTIF